MIWKETKIYIYSTQINIILLLYFLIINNNFIIRIQFLTWANWFQIQTIYEIKWKEIHCNIITIDHIKKRKKKMNDKFCHFRVFVKWDWLRTKEHAFFFFVIIIELMQLFELKKGSRKQITIIQNTTIIYFFNFNFSFFVQFTLTLVWFHNWNICITLCWRNSLGIS